jgi:hypothetical protein
MEISPANPAEKRTMLSIINHVSARPSAFDIVMFCVLQAGEEPAASGVAACALAGRRGSDPVVYAGVGHGLGRVVVFVGGHVWLFGCLDETDG